MNLRTLATVAAVAASAALAGCKPSLLPGTEVRATRENEEVYLVVRAYAEALQRKDAAAILALVAPDYLDNAGTVSPEDDLDRAALEKNLAGDLAKVEGFKLELGIKSISVEGDRASAALFYDDYYKVVTPAGGIAKRGSSLHQMTFKRVGADWKITSGL